MSTWAQVIGRSPQAQAAARSVGSSFGDAAWTVFVQPFASRMPTVGSYARYFGGQAYQGTRQAIQGTREVMAPPVEALVQDQMNKQIKEKTGVNVKSPPPTSARDLYGSLLYEYGKSLGWRSGASHLSQDQVYLRAKMAEQDSLYEMPHQMKNYVDIKEKSAYGGNNT